MAYPTRSIHGRIADNYCYSHLGGCCMQWGVLRRSSRTRRGRLRTRSSLCTIRAASQGWTTKCSSGSSTASPPTTQQNAQRSAYVLCIMKYGCYGCGPGVDAGVLDDWGSWRLRAAAGLMWHVLCARDCLSNSTQNVPSLEQTVCAEQAPTYINIPPIPGAVQVVNRRKQLDSDDDFDD